MAVRWRPWHLNFLGFASAWWLLALPLIPAAARHAGTAAPWLGALPQDFGGACAVLTLGIVLAIGALSASQARAVQAFAGWFLIGALTMPLALVVGALLFDLAALNGLLG